MQNVPLADASVCEMLAYTPPAYMLDHARQRRDGDARAFLSSSGASCALLLGHYLFLGGVADETFLRKLEGSLPSARGVLIAFYHGDKETADAVRAAFGTAYENERSLYAYVPGSRPALAHGRVRRITDSLLASGMDNTGMIVEEVLSTGTYPDMRAFCESGIGMAYAEGNRVRGFCTSEYPCAGALAIGIAVEEDCRRQGIGTEMTDAFLELAEARGVRVFWECWKRNEPSVRTARKCGFEKVADYPVLILPGKE